MHDIVHDPAYEALDDVTRAQAVELAYDYAASMAKRNTNEAYSPDKWMAKLADLEKSGGDAAEYLMLRAQSKVSGKNLTETALASADLSVNDQADIIVMEVTMPADFTDPYVSGYEYVMDETQQVRYAQVYHDLFTEGFEELVETNEYRTGDTDKRLELVKELKSEVSKQTKREMSDWLYGQGIESTEKS